MKKIMIPVIILLAFVLGMVFSEMILDGINRLIQSDFFNTRGMVERKFDKLVAENEKLQDRLQRKADAVSTLLEEMQAKDFGELAKEELMSGGKVPPEGQLRVEEGMGEIYFKPRGGEDPGVNAVRETLNRKVKKILDVSGDILHDKITDLNEELVAMNNRLKEKNLVLQQNLLELEKYREALDRQQEYIGELKNIQADLNSKVGELQTKIENGRLRVDFKGDILFESGRHTLTRKGKKLLGSVAPVLLENMTKNDILIAGHTDNVPIREDSRDKYASNWELSTFRAVEVVKYLAEKGIRPQSLTAAGYGKFKPVADNSTEEGRSRNRRVELFLIPRIIKR